MRAILVFVLSFVIVSAAPKNTERIIGGIQTSINQYPFMTALMFPVFSSYYRQFCGGSIINTRSILSAAHCIQRDDAPRLRLRVGSTYAHSGGVVYSVDAIINHPLQSIALRDHDISIIRTASPIVYGVGIQPAVIAGGNYDLPNNAVVWVVGWGTTQLGLPSEELLHAQVWTIIQETCRRRYAEINLVVSNNMFCSGWLDQGGRGPCNGDSGGPVVHNNVVVGITSWSRECALGQYPTVNVRTSSYTAWIQENSN